MSVVKIPLSNGGVTLVDDDVAKEIKGHKLYYYRYDHCRYAKIYKDGKLDHLHRVIMKPAKGMCVDHINGNPLDNRRENLRIVAHWQNMLNRRRSPRSKSGYRIVFVEKNDAWRIQLKVNGKYCFSGSYRSKHIAGIFADRMLVLNVGTFVMRNFPEKITIESLSKFFERTSGRIFRVVFSRRSDGRQREMVCRTGVNSRHNNGTIPFDPISLGLFSVYDVHKRAYRFIPLENVICVRFAKTNYRVVA